ncbi:MAG: hypothetical protein LC803_09460 [Acidobacteria bacterium]|nr:hypothetical protein [Acidobacteriota bacterium]
MNKPIRHGEVLLFPVQDVPTAKVTQHTSYIVGHSETGHHHVLESKTKFDALSTQDKDLYIRLFAPGTLTHKKTVNRHNDLTVPAGTYRVIRKNEYDPFQKVMREVWD